jgi:hypothetical protein
MGADDPTVTVTFATELGVRSQTLSAGDNLMVWPGASVVVNGVRLSSDEPCTIQVERATITWKAPEEQNGTTRRARRRWRWRS